MAATHGLTETAAQRASEQDTVIHENTELHTREIPAQISRQQTEAVAGAASTAEQYSKLMGTEEIRLLVERERVELQREQNKAQKASVETDRKYLALEEVMMSQQADVDHSKRVIPSPIRTFFFFFFLSSTTALYTLFGTYAPTRESPKRDPGDEWRTY